MTRSPWMATTALLICSLHAPRSWADGYENVPTGSRTAAMGGAGIAGGSDSAMPLLNPAGLALIPGSIASLSASLYQLGFSSIPNYISDNDTVQGRYGSLQVSQRGVASTEFGSFPSGLTYFLHLGPGKAPMTIAASLSVPRNVNRRFLLNTEFLGDGVSVKETLSTIVQETSYMAAASWGGAFGDLRLGVSLLGTYTSVLRTADRSQLVVLGTTNFFRSQVKAARSIDSFDGGLMIGAQYDVAEWLQLGISIRSPSLHLLGSFTSSVDQTQVDGDLGPTITSIQADGDGTRGFPLRIGAGAQLHGDSWSLAIDGVVFMPRSKEYRLVGKQVLSDLGDDQALRPDQSEDIESAIPTQLVVNVSVGFEYQITESNWLRLGVFTSQSAVKSASEQLADLPMQRINPDLVFQFPIDRFGASVGLGSKVGPIDTTFGIRGTYGAGDTFRFIPDQRFNGTRLGELTSATVAEALFFISAAVDVSEGAAALMDTVSGGGGESL